MDWNQQLFTNINQIGAYIPFLNPFFVIIAEWSVYALLIFLIVSFFFSKNRSYEKAALNGSIAFIVSEMIAKLLISRLHYNEQPFAVLQNVNQLIIKEVDNSFPSDHTILIFSFMFSFYLFEKNKSKKKWFLLVAVLVGLSRILVGVHYPLDILVGALLSITTVTVCAKWIRYDLLLQIKDKILSLFARKVKPIKK